MIEKIKKLEIVRRLMYIIEMRKIKKQMKRDDPFLYK